MSAPLCNDAFLQSFGQCYKKKGGYSVYFYMAQQCSFPSELMSLWCEFCGV